MIDDLEPGKSYGCKFLVRKGLRSQEMFGVIGLRDSEKQLVEVYPVDSEAPYVVHYTDCWAVDEVDYSGSD